MVMMDAVILVISWTLFVPPAHDVDVRSMPDMTTCLDLAKSITAKVADLERDGVRARLVARCVAVPTSFNVCSRACGPRRSHGNPET